MEISSADFLSDGNKASDSLLGRYADDGFDRLTGVSYDSASTPRYTYEYDASGCTSVVKDHALNSIFQTECDLSNRPMGTQLRNGDGSLIYRTMLNYDKQNRLIGFGETADTSTYRTTYAYDNDNRVTEIDYDGSTHKVKYTYDNLGRVNSRTIEGENTDGNLTSAYSYEDGGYGADSTTPLVKKIAQNGVSFEYEYDTRGNIVSEKRGDLTTTYEYDALGQLIRVNDPHENATWIYHYDCGGNMTNKAKYVYTTGELGEAVQTVPYTYDDTNWKDKLTSYNGQTITYDAIGNPTNDGVWSYEWQAGRHLKQMSKAGMIVQFKYDQNGLRVGKVVNGIETKYILHGKLLMHMTCGSDALHFFYDAQSRPVFVEYSGAKYVYMLNLQGDIVALLDSNGATMVEYKYDAWGKPISTTGTMASTLGKLNPFRYRGYVYDEETGLYYLRSRYYNPEQLRFVNADTYIRGNGNINSHNVFIYCQNNSPRYVDPSGHVLAEHSGIGGGGGVVLYYAPSIASKINGWLLELKLRVLVAVGVGGYAITVYNPTGNTTSQTQSVQSTQDKLNDIASSFRNLECHKAARKMSNYLKKKQDDGWAIALLYDCRYGSRTMIYSETAGCNISENGIHVGIYYDDRIHCNVHPTGLPEEEWKADFYSRGVLVLEYFDLDGFNFNNLWKNVQF